MKHLNYLLWTLAAGILLCSCTITKRHFGNGYHIEWKRKYQESVPEPDAFKEISRQNDEEIDSVPQIREPEKSAEVQVQEIEPVPEETNSPSIRQTDEVVFREKSVPSEIKAAPVAPAENPERTDNWEEEDQTIHPLTWALISVLALGAVSFGLIIANIFFVFGVIGFAFIGMILGIVALISLKRHPEKYRKKGLTRFFAIFLIVAGGVVTLFTALFLVLSYFYL